MSGPTESPPAFALPRAQDGADTITEAVAEAAGAGNWEELSCMSLLLGSQDAVSERVWTLEQLEILREKSLPCWVLRYAPFGDGIKQALYALGVAYIQVMASPQVI